MIRRSSFVIAILVATVPLAGQTSSRPAQTGRYAQIPQSRYVVPRTAWGDPDLQGEWTSEGEYGVPFERPPQFGTRHHMSSDGPCQSSASQ